MNDNDHKEMIRRLGGGAPWLGLATLIVSVSSLVFALLVLWSKW